MSESKRKPKERKPAKGSPAPTGAADLTSKVTKAAMDVTRKASAMAGEGIASIKSTAGESIQAVRNEVESVRDEARQSFLSGRQTAIDWEQGVERKIKSRPLISVLIAVGIGFVLGTWLWRDRDRR